MYHNIDTFVTLSSAIAALKHRKNLYNCKDLTFIITYGTDSEERRRNFGLCLLNLLFNTDAKIKVYWSETIDGLRTSTCGHAVVKNITKFFRHNSSAVVAKDCIHEKISVVDARGEDVGDRTFVTVLTEIMLCSLLDNFKTSSSQTVGDFLASSLDTQNVSEAPIRLERTINTLKNEISERVSCYVELREPASSFHRMRYLNKLLNAVDTPIVCNLDVDVIIAKSAMIEAVEKIRNTDIDFIYPYSENERSQIRIFPDEPSLSTIIRACITGDFVPVMARTPHFIEGGVGSWGVKYGLAFFAKTKSYKKAYGENEALVSWGPDDLERYNRFCKLGFKIARVLEGYVFHIEHPGGDDSGVQSKNFRDNIAVWERIQKLGPTELETYYSQLSYVKEHSFG